MASKKINRLPVISHNRLGFNKEIILDKVMSDKASVHPLFHLVGEASAAEPREGEHGEYIVFKGAFEALDPETNEVLARSGKCIVPHLVESELALVIANGDICRIALTVGVQFAKNSKGSPYVLTVDTYATDTSESFKDLKSLIPGFGLMLEDDSEDAPKTIAKTAAKKKK